MRNHLLAKTLVTGLGIAALAVPGVANAARLHPAWHPHRNRGLTIAATPDAILAGQGVLIYGALRGSDDANQPIYLYHRINPAARFTLIGRTTTNADGFYEFVRADGIVNSNRNWFVLGPDGTHSRTVHEWVSPIVTLSTSTTSGLTGQPVTFTGNVFPDHPNQRVFLQEQDSASGTAWHTIAVGMTDSSSNFSISHTFKLPGDYTLRAFFPRDPRNIAGESSVLTIPVQQAENSQFTINASAPLIADGTSETISGTLYQTGSTTAGQPNVPVTLYGRQWGHSFKVLATGSTDANGNYTFTQTPLHNSVYMVKTSTGTVVATAELFIGVQDTVTINTSATTSTVGGSVTVSGTVAPDHVGHVVNLQRQTPNGNWVNVASGAVTTGSTYSFSYTFGQAGTYVLRAQVPGGPVNVGGASSATTITVSGIAPVTSLPPAS